MKRTLVLMLAAVAYMFCGNVGLWAQCYHTRDCFSYEPNEECGLLPPGAVCGLPGAIDVQACSWKDYRCPPAAGVTETRGSCPNCNKPISLTDGNTYITQTDISVPGLGGGLKLERTWNSIWPSTQITSQIGIFGKNWSSNIEERAFVGSDSYVKYARGNGSFWSFAWSEFGTGETSILKVAAPANATETLVAGASTWTITDKSGNNRVFNATTGQIQSITDRNGNTTQFTYDSVLRLVTVTDPASRHLYFTYGQGDQFYLVSSVTSDVGISMSYAYDDCQRLVQVTKPDNAVFNFEYGQSSINDVCSPLITAVKDGAGKILEAHSYDGEGKGLTGTEALGVNAVTITWPDHVFRLSDPLN